jgi:hypothetical protein
VLSGDIEEALSETTLTDIRQQIDVCGWQIIQPHIEKANLFIVADELDFADVAFTIAQDNADKVRTMLSKNHIFRLEPELLYTWNQIPDKKFRLIVLAPYLLIQEVLDS